MQLGAKFAVTVLIANREHRMVMSQGLVDFCAEALTGCGGKPGAGVAIITALVDYECPRQTGVRVHFGIDSLSVIPVEQAVRRLKDTGTTVQPNFQWLKSLRTQYGFAATCI